MKTVDDIEEIREELKKIFPDAIRGSVAKSHWGKGRKMLHLFYSFGGDTAGGYIIRAVGDLLYFIDWDTNEGYQRIFAESDIETMIKRVKKMFKGKVLKFDRPVNFPRK